MREATNGEYPHFAIWENVPGSLTSHNGGDFRAVLEEITEAEAQKRDNSTGIVIANISASNSLTFYEGTNDIQVRFANDIRYYRASYLYDDTILISDLVRSWFDEAEYYDLLNQWVLQTSMVPDYGQDYLIAAQEFSQRYRGKYGNDHPAVQSYAGDVDSDSGPVLLRHLSLDGGG